MKGSSLICFRCGPSFVVATLLMLEISISSRVVRAEDKEPLGWRFAGPTTYVSAFDSNDDWHRPSTASAGAVQKIVEGNHGAWFLGSVNGGVWKTTNLTTSSTQVHWTNVLDGQAGINCNSIGALSVSMSPSHPDRVYAGCGGSTSSEQGSDWNVVNSGDWGGIMRSEDNGNSWKMLKGFPPNYYVTDILEYTQGNNNTILLVAAQSHLYDRDNGGIWKSTDDGENFKRVDARGWPYDKFSAATFTLTKLFSGGVLATHARNRTFSVSRSVDDGLSFSPGKLEWEGDPFYTCACELGDGRWVVAGLTRLSDFPNNTDSQFFIKTSHPSDDNNDGDNGRTSTNYIRSPNTFTGADRLSIRSSDKHSGKWAPFPQPERMDQDGMPKDRMALLADPDLGDIFYVAGNAGALAWRVNATSQTWTKLWGEDVEGMPHGDCRNFAWDSEGDRLLLVGDGGLFAREQPRQDSGRWVSLNGDYASLELLSAHYDPNDGRFVAGAQDNCAIVTKPNAKASDPGYCFVEGDGTVTLVDSSVNPSRLFGTTQFLGVGTIDIDPQKAAAHLSRDSDNDDDDDDDDDDGGCGGLCFAQGDKYVNIPIHEHFPDPSFFPFFVHPYVLNFQDPTKLHFWVNGTTCGGIYEFRIPYSVNKTEDIPEPTLVLNTPPGAMILDFVSGGYTAGVEDPDLILAVSNTHMYVRSRQERDTKTEFVERPLPVQFAMPVTLDYDPDTGDRILGPLTHARTIFLEVASSDSNVVVVTGWTSIDDNKGDESVFLSSDAGKSWKDITGNLKEASGVVGKVRPSGLKLIDLNTEGKNGNADTTARALLVGTSNGIVATKIESLLKQERAKTIATPNPEQEEDEKDDPDQEQVWFRFGTLDEFPIVLTSDIDYEPKSDKLVAATMGRGIYVLDDAKEKLVGSMAGKDETFLSKSIS